MCHQKTYWGWKENMFGTAASERATARGIYLGLSRDSCHAQRTRRKKSGSGMRSEALSEALVGTTDVCRSLKESELEIGE